jgi:hypothetical protein
MALRALDVAACRLGSSREELVLGLADKSEAERFRRRHGVSPRSVKALLQLIGLRGATVCAGSHRARGLL